MVSLFVFVSTLLVAAILVCPPGVAVAAALEASSMHDDVNTDQTSSSTTTTMTDSKIWFLPVPQDETMTGNVTDAELRRLAGHCPHKERLQEAWFNTIFDVITEKKTRCSADELGKIAYVLDKEFELLMLSGNTYSSNNMGDWVQDMEYKICRRKSELKAAAAKGPQPIDDGYRRVRDRRNLETLGFRIYLYRSLGRCFFCSADDWDNRLRRSLAHGVSAEVEGFASIISGFQGMLNDYMVEQLQIRVNRGRIPCLDNVGMSVTSTVAIKEEALRGRCSRVKCCATNEDPQLGCSDHYGASEYCHTTQDRCEGDCSGFWIDATNPPTCKGWSKPCDGPKDNSCCRGSVCHSYNPGYRHSYYQCVPEAFLKN